MRVLLLGGYGVFGSRLAELLCRDGHRVTIAGRDLVAAEALAARLGAGALRLDRQGDLAALAGHDVVVDAAGPFHSYGEDRYRLPRAAIAAGVHYLDLSDDAGFCAGIAELDGAAQAAGVAVLSGLSSVPALSSAAVEALAGGDALRMIDTAILPGNRAPRGLSVMRSILAQVGRPVPVWQGGRWQRVPGWSDPADYALPGGVMRQGWRIEVADTRLFPAHFGAETVTFRAGLELGAMRYGLAMFGRLQRVLALPISHPLLLAFKWIADRLEPFGSGRGGMVVTVLAGEEWRSWRLIAEDGEGPFIPAVAARALLRRATLPASAGPAIAAITLAEAEAAMADLAVRTIRDTAPFAPIFQQVLGDDFAALPEAIRATHRSAGSSHWQGRARVQRGSGLWPRLIAALFGFPPASDDIPVSVTKTVTAKGEVWTRDFAARRFRSALSASPAGMIERFGPFRFLLGLHVAAGALHFPVRRGWLGPLPLPRWLLPAVAAREYVEAGRFHFDVALSAPLGGAMVRYRGWLVPAPPDDPAPP